MKRTRFLYFILLVFSSYSFAEQYSGFSGMNFWDSMEWKRPGSSNDFKFNLNVQKVEKNFTHFCEDVASSGLTRYDIAPLNTFIPPILHFIWLGSSITLPTKVAIESWQKHHKEWEIRLWTDEEVKNFSWTTDRLYTAYQEATTWAEKADILRLDILYQFGGIYSDVDVICLHSFHDLLIHNVTFFSCFELNYTSPHYQDPFYIGTAVLGAIKGSRIMKYALDHCKTVKEEPNLGILKRTGPGLVSRACQASLEDPNERILILPCSYIYPFPWKRRNEDANDFIHPNSLTIHLWNNSWMK